ncbi:hypothetical protein EJB05_33209, partial [Eragrostis curvula]
MRRKGKAPSRHSSSGFSVHPSPTSPAHSFPTPRVLSTHPNQARSRRARKLKGIPWAPSSSHELRPCYLESGLTSFTLVHFTGNSDEYCRCQACLGKYTLLGDEENPRLSMFERRLPCFGCGIGWCWFFVPSHLAVIFTAATIIALSVLLICCINKRFLHSCAI